MIAGALVSGGVEVRLVNQEWKAFLRSQRKGEYQISLSSWIVKDHCSKVPRTYFK